MPLPPIAVTLTKFENIEVLRQEIQTREEELKETEKHIRSMLFELERQKYLKSIHPFFHTLKEPPEAAQVAQWQAKREALGEALLTLKGALEDLETETKGQVAPPSSRSGLPRPGAPGAPAPKKRFDSFDDFKTQQKPPSPGAKP